MKKTILLLPLLSLLLLFHANGQTLLQKDNLQYMGAFKVPLGEANGSRFGYGGTAPVYNPANNSLFMVGHAHHQMVAEITIPEAVNSSNLEDLNRADFVQPFTDVTEGQLSTVDSTDIVNGFRVGGLLLHNGTLINSAYAYYDADRSQISSHFQSSPDWSVMGEVQGAYQVGTTGAGFVSGYMTPIPIDWQADFGGPALTGNCCIPIISRSSFGPSAFVFDPSDLGVENPVPTTPLLYYPQEHPLADWDETNLLFNGSTQITGMLFPENSQSVLFFGRHGTGTFCYGAGETCGDPVNPYQGTHAYPYIYQVWAYDALDLLAVKNGTKQAWEVQPYATWELELPIPEEGKTIGGIAYNQEAGLIYVSQRDVEGLSNYPVIHTFKINIENTDTTEPIDTTEIMNPTVSCDCEPLPAPTNTTIRVSTVTELHAAMEQANSSNGDITILLEDGTYELRTNLFYIGTNISNLTLRSVSGNRDAVIIRGQGMTGSVSHIFNVAASNFTVVDMTIGWVANHPIQIHGEHNADNCLIQNVRFVDGNEQLLKVSGYQAVESSDNGVVQCCLFEFSAGVANQSYTGGIDAHKAQNWIVRNNTFKHIRSPDEGLAEHAIHFWSGAGGTIVENNLIINCDRGIGFGLGSGQQHTGGLIRNNMVHTSRDVGIGLENASGAKVYNNTVITDNYPRSIEYRFTGTRNAHIANNLTSGSITARDGGTGIIENNFSTTDKSIFVDANRYDFHLVTSQSDIIDAGKVLPEISGDYDCDDRLDAPDIGADEYGRNPCTNNTFYADTDNDGYGDATVSITACEAPTGYVVNSDDCDDTNAALPTTPGSSCPDGIIAADGCTCTLTTFTPDCSTVATNELMVGDITETSAYAYTSQPYGTVNNQFRYRTNGAIDWELTDLSTSYYRLLSNLRPETDYEVQVAQECSAGQWSDFSGSQFFTTQGQMEETGCLLFELTEQVTNCQIAIDIIEGTGPYTLTISGPNATISQDLHEYTTGISLSTRSLSRGTYKVTLQDENNCEMTQSFTVITCNNLDQPTAVNNELTTLSNSENLYKAISVKTIMNVQVSYPNPFTTNTYIPFNLIKNSRVTLEVFLATGQQVYQKQYDLLAGNQQLELQGHLFPDSGLYLYRISTKNQFFSGKLTKL